MGETFAHSAVLECLSLSLSTIDSDGDADVDGIQAWLRRDRRLIELASGKALTRAHMVRVAAAVPSPPSKQSATNMTVVEMLPSGKEREWREASKDD
jgi:hypothetical protein